MSKTSFWRHKILGELLELGNSTAEKSAKQLGQTFSPLKILEEMIKFDDNHSLPEKKTAEKEKKPNSTLLNFKELEEKYKGQDESLRQRFFQLVKKGEEETLQRQKQKEAEKERMEAYKEQEKKRKEEERKKQEGLAETPRGKIRRSIFSPKKVVKIKQTYEVKPAVGKQ